MPGITFTENKTRNFERLAALDREPNERLDRAILMAAPDDELLQIICSKLNEYKGLELWIEIPNGAPFFDLDRLPLLHNVRKLILRSGWTSSSLSIISEKIKDLESLDIEPGLNKKLSLEPIKLLKRLKRLQIEKMSLDIEKAINGLELDYLYLAGMRKSGAELSPLCDEISFCACSEEFIGSFNTKEVELVSLGSSRSICSLKPLNALGRIKSLYLYELYNIESLSGFKHAGEVENLFIKDVKKLQLDEAINQYAKLNFLKIVGDSAVSKLQLRYLNNLSRLKYGQVIIEDNGELDYEAFPLIKFALEKEEALFRLRDVNL